LFERGNECHRRLLVMPINPTFKLSIAEWRTVLAAARHYREYLAATAPD
jgi:hypothetical protein